jgi:uncharacterized protein (TIGR03086 family)
VAPLTQVEALLQAEREFHSRLTLVSEGQWDDQSACDDWSVGDLVDHVIGGNVFTIAILGGAAAEAAVEAAIQGATMGETRRHAAYEESAGVMLERFAVDDALGQDYDHVAGTLSGFEVAALRAEDIALHAWDLASSIGVGEQLDPALVEFVWDRMSPRAHELAANGRYGSGTRGDLADGVTLQARLLDITGRDPGRSLG